MADTHLPSVTLCAATSVNLPATLAAISACQEGLSFADCILFSHEAVDTGGVCRLSPIPRLSSSFDYSMFMLRDLAEHVRTSHCLVVQWDGFVLNPGRWDPAFLEFDYIGASWPQFSDGRDVGNGGFSLRSRHLLEACRDPRFQIGEAEDVAICRVNRTFLEDEYSIRFADREVAELFSFERTKPAKPPFGFHGVFNMVEAVGPDRFWDAYLSLEDRRTTYVDFWRILRQLGRGEQTNRRRLRLISDRLSDLFGS